MFFSCIVRLTVIYSASSEVSIVQLVIEAYHEFSEVQVAMFP